MRDIESIRKQLDRGEFDPADAALDEALSKTPGDEELLALRGSLRHLQRRFQAAAEDFEAALSKQPDEANWHNALGKSLNNLQQTAAAESAFRRSLEIEPGNAETWHNLAFALRAQGRNHQAADAFSEALQIKPDYVSAWHNAGLVYLNIDDPDQALAAFLKAQTLAADRPRLATHIGVALHNLGRYEDAVAAYRKALSGEPEAEAQNNLAVSLQELGRDDEALAAYREAALLAPDDQEIQIKIANLLIGMGQPDQAIDIARQCLARAPGHTGALAVAAVAGQEPGCRHLFYLPQLFLSPNHTLREQTAKNLYRFRCNTLGKTRNSLGRPWPPSGHWPVWCQPPQQDKKNPGADKATQYRPWA